MKILIDDNRWFFWHQHRRTLTVAKRMREKAKASTGTMRRMWLRASMQNQNYAVVYRQKFASAPKVAA